MFLAHWGSGLGVRFGSQVCRGEKGRREKLMKLTADKAKGGLAAKLF
jgi:hypothetical protein